MNEISKAIHVKSRGKINNDKKKIMVGSVIYFEIRQRCDAETMQYCMLLSNRPVTGYMLTFRTMSPRMM